MRADGKVHNEINDERTDWGLQARLLSVDLGVEVGKLFDVQRSVAVLVESLQQHCHLKHKKNHNNLAEHAFGERLISYSIIQEYHEDTYTYAHICTH